MARFSLYLDTANSPGANNGECQWALNQAIIGATSCTILALNFVNSIPNIALNFNSTVLTPSNERWVACQGTQTLSSPFFTYILENPSGGLYEGVNSRQFP